MGFISVRHIWEVFLEGIYGRYFLEEYIGGISRRHTWEVFLEDIGERNKMKYFSEVQVTGISVASCIKNENGIVKF